MTRRGPSTATLADQRLNSAHGRFVYAAWRVPARNRYLPSAPGRWAAIEIVAHVVEFQEEALRRLGTGHSKPAAPLSDCSGRLTDGLRLRRWENLLESFERGHLELGRRLRAEPPGWFGMLTHEHYTRHVADLEAWHASAVFRA